MATVDKRACDQLSIVVTLNSAAGIPGRCQAASTQRTSILYRARRMASTDVTGHLPPPPRSTSRYLPPGNYHRGNLSLLGLRLKVIRLGLRAKRLGSELLLGGLGLWLVFKVQIVVKV